MNWPGCNTMWLTGSRQAAALPGPLSAPRDGQLQELRGALNKEGRRGRLPLSAPRDGQLQELRGALNKEGRRGRLPLSAPRDGQLQGLRRALNVEGRRKFPGGLTPFSTPVVLSFMILRHNSVKEKQ